jgi:hypothetical protein
MADDDKHRFEIPWATLLPVIAILAGVVAQFRPLVSTRPSASGEKSIPVMAAQDVDARLWQDPIAVAQKQKAALTADVIAGRVPRNRAERHDISTLVALLKNEAQTIPGKILLLGVMIDAGPYSEQAELRLRARQAVLEGLSESGFIPSDGEHIGYVTTPWPIPADKNLTVTESVENSSLLIPWEQCEAMDDPAHVSPTGTARVVVLWLPAGNFNPFVLSNFAALIDRLAGDIRDKVDVTLLGPANSTGLQNMIREARAARLSSAAQAALDGVSIVSAVATAPDAMLLYEPSAQASHSYSSVSELLEQSVTRGPRGGLHFFRSVATDDVVLKEVIAELQRRRRAVKAKAEAPSSKTVHVVILTEWDTTYGRSLNTTFIADASHRSIKEVIGEQHRSQDAADPSLVRRANPNKNRRSDWQLRRIHSYRYLRGIDGQLPGEPAKENPRDQAQKNLLGPDSVAIEATEGLNQSDYLRRLARQLKESNARWRQRDGVGIGAIGLLGSDIYDKLMILRALRPEFPDALFFTNNYDAHFERRDDLADTRNLIIGSPFGGALPPNYTRQRIAPFRDTNQTSIYAGTLVATGRMDKTVAEYFSWQPRIFEISRRGAYDLSPPWYLKGRFNSPSNKTWFWDWLHSGRVARHLTLGAISLALMVVWVSVSIANRALPGGGNTAQRLKRIVSSTAFWLVCGTPLIIFLVTAFAQTDPAAQEPLAFFSGISIWPSEMLRLIALMLAIHFMIKAGVDLRANERELEERFCLDPLTPKKFHWRDIGIGLDLRRDVLTKTGAEPKFSAEQAWHTYLRRNGFRPRFIRIAVLFAMYFVFSASVFALFPQPSVPARGEVAFRFDFAVLVAAAIAMMILTFYVVDAIQLNSNFIRMFAREVTNWGRAVTERRLAASHRIPPLTEEELSAYHEIFFVAQRTQVVARLIWYPLIVLTLMIVARSSFFDHWTWPTSLILIYALNATWAIGSAVLLRRAAEQLRDAAISNLQLLRVMSLDEEKKRRTFDELIGEIRGLKKGAFAPLTEQPFIRAIIFPSGGLGLLAVGQRLLESF